MDNLSHPESWDEHEIQLEDLDAPDKGFRLFLYNLGEKLSDTIRIRAKSVALLSIIGLLRILFLPNAIWLNAVAHTSGSPSTTSAPMQNTTCQEITVNSKDTNWHIPPSIATPPDSVTLHLCSSNTVHFKIISINASPGASDNNVVRQK